jgi:sulfur transfer complex TusBCD TusB component (DsrH family)
LHCWVPSSANFVTDHEGIHFPLVRKIMNAIEEVEQVIVLRIDLIARSTTKIISAIKNSKR